MNHSHLSSLMADSVEPFSRPLGNTEQTWVRSAGGGTGITVLVILLSKPPDTSLLQTSLHRLQKLHPILTASLSHSTLSSSSYSLLSLQFLSVSSTSDLLLSLSSPEDNHLPPLHLLLEHELNRNPWTDPESDSGGVFFATLYELPAGGMWVLALRLHTAVCDRASGVAIMRELLELMTNGEAVSEAEEENGLSPAVESLIPKGKGDKPFWTRGIDLVGYSLNSVRLSNLEFGDVESTRSTAMVRLELNKEQTHRITQGCNARGIKLCGALAAAGLVAAHLLKSLPDNQSEYFSIATLIDCRKILDPPLHEHNLGFYHSAIINTHSISNGEGLWDVARRCYDAFSNSMKWEKHFKDMGDLNFLMCKAIENPALTPYSSLRTSFMAVFEDPVLEGDLSGSLGVEDYMGCASVHGAGPSIAVFDTIRDGQLDCACVYPFPLHSRKQMQELVDEMKNILVSGGE